jgi:uncharacterized small protein (TIGR04563 family)
MNDNSSSNATPNATPATEKKVDARKQSLYIPEELLSQVKEQAARLDRSVSWVVQRAIKTALPAIRELPGMSDDE